MEPTQELIDDIFRGKVLRARRATPEQRFRAGGDLFDDVCARMMAGIRHQFPEAGEAEVRDILHRRFALLRRMEGSHAQ